MEPEHRRAPSDSASNEERIDSAIPREALDPTAAENAEAGSVRAQLHLALAGILLPVLSLALVWPLALVNICSVRSGRARAVARLLLALALVDGLVAAVVVWTVLDPSIARIAPRLSREAFRIGITGVPDSAGGVRIHSVAPDSPAEETGIRPGDVIVSIDETRVSSIEELQLALNDFRGPVAERVVGVTRSGRSGPELIETVRVRPVRVTAAPRDISLFEPLYAPTDEATTVELADAAASLMPAVIVLLVIAAVIGRRDMRASRPAAWLLVALLASAASGLLADAVIQALAGGSSFGSLTLSMIVQSGALMTSTVPFVRALRVVGDRAPSAPASRLTTRSAVALGILYDLALVPRAAILGLGVAVILSRSGEAAAFSSPLEVFVAVRPPATGIALFFVGAAILAPVGEELAFRGILQPWLSAHTRPATAIGLSSLVFALVHPHYGAFGLVAFTQGLVLGWARHRTGALLAPILLHAIINSLATAGALLI